MTRDEARELIREFMQDTGDDAAAIASLLHPDMTEGDVERYLAGDPAVDEGKRERSIDSIMAKFAQTIEKSDDERSNDLA
jgi:hypothetical protein